MLGARDEDTYLSLASRLARLDRQMDEKEKRKFTELANGMNIKQVTKMLLHPFDPDKVEEEAKKQQLLTEDDIAAEETMKEVQEQMIDDAKTPFNAALVDYVENVRKAKEQIIDEVNLDKVTFAGWDKEAVDKAEETVTEFKEFLEQHKDEITALRIFYNQPYRRRELTYQMIKEVLELLKNQKPTLAPAYVWGAYALLDKVDARSPKSELIALVSLLRRVTGLDDLLTPYDKIVDRNFQIWVFKKQEGAAVKFNEEQMAWLRMIKEHIASSVHLDMDDLDNAPFDGQGGIGKMHQLFGNEMYGIVEELNEVLVA
jgi:type I restriction enzyme R subunit